jgi:hypothetical protein
MRVMYFVEILCFYKAHHMTFLGKFLSHQCKIFASIFLFCPDLWYLHWCKVSYVASDIQPPLPIHIHLI